MFHDFQITPAALSLLSDAKSRSISAENPRGEPNAGALATEGTGAKCARSLGRGWKVSPSYAVQPGETFEMALIEGSGAIQSMWMAGYVGRDVVIRMYWDGQAQPSVECPLSDFFRRRVDDERRGHLRRQLHAAEFRHDRREPESRHELLLADALPQKREDHA